LTRLSGARRVVLAGLVENLPDLYGRHRIFFAPTRYAGGIPFKLHEAASFGLPIVASSILAAQLNWTGEVELLSSPPDPAAFAEQIQRLYTDAELWHRLRDAALARLAAENAFAAYKSQIAQILADVCA
jgi:glycosyltransferase involved in cell wall biosynthesis